NTEIVRLLLDRGANINAQGDQYGTILHTAVRYGNIEVVRLLLDRGADINVQGGQSGTVLQSAIDKKEIKVIELLLEKGVDISYLHSSYSYLTILQVAAKMGKTEVILKIL